MPMAPSDKSELPNLTAPRTEKVLEREAAPSTETLDPILLRPKVVRFEPRRVQLVTDRQLFTAVCPSIEVQLPSITPPETENRLPTRPLAETEMTDPI